MIGDKAKEKETIKRPRAVDGSRERERRVEPLKELLLIDLRVRPDQPLCFDGGRGWGPINKFVLREDVLNASEKLCEVKGLVEEVVRPKLKSFFNPDLIRVEREEKDRDPMSSALAIALGSR